MVGISTALQLKKDNIFACQFHPEKSGSAGIAIYKSIFDKVNESK